MQQCATDSSKKYPLDFECRIFPSPRLVALTKLENLVSPITLSMAEARRDGFPRELKQI